MNMSIAKELADRFVRKLKFTSATEEDARELQGSCDIVLSKNDGWNYYIACIVDARDAEFKVFGFDRTRVREILASRSQRYTNAISVFNEPAVLYIVELRRDCNEEHLARLRNYGNLHTDADFVHAYIVDCTAWQVRRATPWTLFHSQERFLRRQMNDISRYR